MSRAPPDFTKTDSIFRRSPSPSGRSVGPQIYRHIILAVHHIPSGRYGAIGLSRKEELMYKDLKYGSMTELLED